MPRLRKTRPLPVRAAQIDNLESRTLLSATGLAPVSGAQVDVQSIDGTGNNVANPDLGSTGENLERIADANYADGVGEPNEVGLPSAREVSNVVAAQSESVINERYLTDATWLWGQFLDHDIDLSLTTGETGNPEAFDIEVPTGDPLFDPFFTGEQTIPLTRSEFDDSSGVREQINHITAFIDGSNVYGSDAERADALRTFEDGKLKTSEGDLLPFNEEGLENAGGTSETLFLAGDVRANENVGLTSIHTLFVREHNRLADEIAERDSSLSDEEIYQEARRTVIAEIQAITYNEFLPSLLGHGALDRYDGYDANVNPNISNEFSTAAYRLGHSLLSPELLRIGADGEVIDDGNLSLREAFFNPSEVSEEGIDAVLRGVTVGLAQELDAQVIDDVRNFLFGPPGSGGLDLAALNIQRGRDHGLGSYNDTRESLGLDAADSFSDITSDVELQAKLEDAYGDVDSIELWIGLLSEDHLANSSVGETMQRIISDQFENLRDGDRFWYENIYSGRELRELQNTTLGDIIERNTEVEGLQDNVFFDAGVTIHNLPEGRQSNDVKIVVTDTNVFVQNGHDTEVYTREGMKQFMLLGSDGSADRVSVDVRHASDPLAGGVVFVAGDGGRDTLSVVGSRGSDSVDVTEETVAINGEFVTYSGVETIDLKSLTRGDAVTIGNDVDARIVTNNGRGGNHGPRSGHGNDRDRDERNGRDRQQDGPRAQTRDQSDNQRRVAKNGNDRFEQRSNRG